MELKDLILETLNELSTPNDNKDLQPQVNPTTQNVTAITLPAQSSSSPFGTAAYHKHGESLREECEFLEMLQERLLVLFDGLNAPQHNNIESKLHITMNFLEYELSVIAERLNDIKR